MWEMAVSLSQIFRKITNKICKIPPPHLLNNVKVLYVLDFVAFKDFHVFSIREAVED